MTSDDRCAKVSAMIERRTAEFLAMPPAEQRASVLAMGMHNEDGSLKDEWRREFEPIDYDAVHDQTMSDYPNIMARLSESDTAQAMAVESEKQIVQDLRDLVSKSAILDHIVINPHDARDLRIAELERRVAELIRDLTASGVLPGEPDQS